MAENLENNEEVVLDQEETKEASVKELMEEIEKLKKENEKYYDHLQRTAAEFDNYKKRVMKDKDDIYQLAVGDVVTKYIAVLDNLDKAVASEVDPKVKEGVELIQKQVLDIMKDLKVERIATDKETFNPEYHDAVMHIESKDYGDQEIVEELRSGYKLGNRVLRHSMVKVAN